jgi:hypothetical protein
MTRHAQEPGCTVRTRDGIATATSDNGPVNLADLGLHQGLAALTHAPAADDLWPFVDRRAARIASFPPHAVREAKASVLLAETGVEADLLAGPRRDGAVPRPGRPDARG